MFQSHVDSLSWNPSFLMTSASCPKVSLQLTAGVFQIRKTYWCVIGYTWLPLVLYVKLRLFPFFINLANASNALLIESSQDSSLWGFKVKYEAFLPQGDLRVAFWWHIPFPLGDTLCWFISMEHLHQNVVQSKFHVPLWWSSLPQTTLPAKNNYNRWLKHGKTNN